MKKIATIALVAAGTFGFAGASFAEGCNWGAKASMYTAEADMTPIPEEAATVAEAPDGTEAEIIVKNETDAADDTTVVAQAPITE